MVPSRGRAELLHRGLASAAMILDAVVGASTSSGRYRNGRGAVPTADRVGTRTGEL